jgi:hypothetical protein
MATNKLKLGRSSEELEQQVRSEQTQTLDGADRAQAFYLAEYESLRTEILQTLTDSRNLERNIVFAVGVSLAWIMSHRNLHPLVWFIPLALVSVGILRSGALLISFGLYAEYIRRVEDFLTDGKRPGGWETFREHKSLGISVTAFVFWGLMLAGSIFIIVKKPTVASEGSAATQALGLSGNATQPATGLGAAIGTPTVRETNGNHHN